MNTAAFRLGCGVSRGHDGARKLTAVNARIAVGCDGNAPVVYYRRWNGQVERMSRDDTYRNGEALAARERILETALHYALLGVGVSGAMLLTTMLGAAGRVPRGWRDETCRWRSPGRARHRSFA